MPQLFLQFFLKIAKREHYTKAALLIIIGLCFFLSSISENPFNRACYQFLSTFQVPQKQQHTVVLASNQRDSSITRDDMLAAIKTGLIFGAESIVLLGDARSDGSTNWEHRSFEALVSKNSKIHHPILHLQHGRKIKESQSSQRVLIKKGLRFPLGSLRADSPNKADSFYSLPQSSFQQELCKVAKGSPIPHVAVLAAADLYGADTVSFSPTALQFSKSGQKLFSLFTGFNTRIVPSDREGLFFKHGILQIPLKSLSSFFTLLHAKEESVMLLSFYTANSVYPDIVETKNELLHDILNFPEEKQFQEMFANAYDDSEKLESEIIEKAEEILRRRPEQYLESELRGMRLALDEIYEVNSKLAPLKSIQNAALVIDLNSFPKASFHSSASLNSTQPETPAFKTAALIHAIANKEALRFSDPLLTLLLLTAIGLLLFFGERRLDRRRFEELSLISSGGLFVVNILSFNIMNYMLCPSSLHLFPLFALLTGRGYRFFRSFYLHKVRLRYGVNLTQKNISSIASSDEPGSYDGRKTGTMLRFSIDSLIYIEEHLPFKAYNSFIKRVSSAVYSIANNFNAFVSETSIDSYTIIFYGESSALSAIKYSDRLSEHLQSIRELLLKRKVPVELVWNYTLDHGSLYLITADSYNFRRVTAHSSKIALLPFLSSIHKEYGTDLVVTEEALSALGANFDSQLLDKCKIAQPKTLVTLFRVLKGAAKDSHGERKEFLRDYHQAHRLFYLRRFEEARILFKRALKISPSDGPSKLFVKRCNYYLKNDAPLSRTVELKAK